jgi:hypothetical protein
MIPFPEPLLRPATSTSASIGMCGGCLRIIEIDRFNFSMFSL